MKTFLIDEQNLKALIQYLEKKPFVEVVEAIRFLSTLKEYKDGERD